MWIKFLSDVDYRHESRAVTKYKADMVLNVPRNIVNNLPEGSYEEYQKPDEGERIELNG